MLVTACHSYAAEPSVREPWSSAAAHDYLNGRTEWWLTWKPAQQKQGTVCLSCHTTVPYVIARTLSSQQPPQRTNDPFTTLLTSTRKREKLWGELEPYDTAHQAASRGTESVLNALMLALNDAAAEHKQTSDDTRKALARMWTQQATSGKHNGAWEWFEFSLAPFESQSHYYGASLAAVAVAKAPGYLASLSDEDRVHVDRLLDYLQRNFADQSLHQQLTGVWASTFWTGALTVAQQQQAIRAALARQNQDGGWSATSLGDWQRRDKQSQSTASDGYGTAIVIASLKAVAHGEQQAALARGIAWLRTHQSRDDGSWPAESLNGGYESGSDESRFLRDAATGWALVALDGETK